MIHYVSKRQSDFAISRGFIFTKFDFAISRGFYFHETSWKCILMNIFEFTVIHIISFNKDRIVSSILS